MSKKFWEASKFYIYYIIEGMIKKWKTQVRGVSKKYMLNTCSARLQLILEVFVL